MPTHVSTHHRKRDFLFAWLAFMLCLLAFLATSGLMLTMHQLGQQKTILDTLLRETEQMAGEGKSIINRLNAQNPQGCSEALLKEMRRELFFATRIADIGYLEQGQLLCTTSSGILETPYQEPANDYVGPEGFSFRPDAKLVMFDGKRTAPVIGKGHFNAVIDSRSLPENLPDGYHWELVFVGQDGSTRHAFGAHDLFEGGDGQVRVTAREHYLQACSEKIPYCAGLSIPNLQLVVQNLRLLLFLLILAVLASASFGLFVFYYLRQRFSLEGRIRRGVDAGAFFPVYQPIVDLESGKVIGCEVLARFEDTLGALEPDAFIPELVRLDKSWFFTERLLRRSLEELSQHPEFPAGFKVNFNAFPGTIMNGQIRVIESMAVCMDSTFRIVFEITEDEQLDSLAARSTLTWLREVGFGLAVDDFGTGYSNFSKLQELACHSLKIDRSFVTDMERGGVKATLVPLMIQIGLELGMEVVVEGVENAEQADLALELGATYGQGWLYGKPMAAQSLRNLISAQSLHA